MGRRIDIVKRGGEHESLLLFGFHDPFPGALAMRTTAAARGRRDESGGAAAAEEGKGGSESSGSVTYGGQGRNSGEPVLGR